MSNSNTNLQTQSSNALHNAIMEAGSKYRPPMLAPGIDNDIHFTVDACPNAQVKCGKQLKDDECACQKSVSCYKSSSECTVLTLTTTRMTKMQHQNEVNEIKRKDLRTVSACYLLLKTTVYHHQTVLLKTTQYSSTRSQQSTRNRGKAIVTSSAPTYDPEPDMVTEDDEISKDKEIDKLMALISLSFKEIYKPTNNNLRTSSNTSRANQDNSPRIIREWV
ncbi:hypothetical protein Tco_0186401 [Tanacetum coccineum]